MSNIGPIHSSSEDSYFSESRRNTASHKRTSSLSYFDFIKKTGGIKVGGETSQGETLYLHVNQGYQDEVSKGVENVELTLTRLK